MCVFETVADFGLILGGRAELIATKNKDKLGDRDWINAQAEKAWKEKFSAGRER